jgi:HEPN domain-containing protein
MQAPSTSQKQTLSDFQQSARKRLADAYELLEPPSRDKRRSRQHQDGAVYLAGYAVECALKAFLIRKAQVSNPSAQSLEEAAVVLGFAKKRFLVHLLEQLRDDGDLLARMAWDPEITNDFNICLKWKPEWRYRGERVKEVEPREFVDAVGRMYRWVERQVP